MAATIALEHLGEFVRGTWFLARKCSNVIDSYLSSLPASSEKEALIITLLRNTVSDLCCCLDALERGTERPLSNNLRMAFEDYCLGLQIQFDPKAYGLFLFDSQTQAKLLACFLAKFFWDKNTGTGILSGDAHFVRRRPESRFAACMPLHFDSQTQAKLLACFLAKFFWDKNTGTGILSGDAHFVRRRPESRFAACMPLHFDSQTQAKLLACFLAKIFWDKNTGTGILSGDAHFVRRRPESRFAACMPLHFDSQTQAKLLACFLAKFFWQKNMARTGIEPATQGFSVLCSTD